MHERQDMKDNDSGKLIAIVEDDPDIARIIEQVLGDFGFDPWCRSGNDLLRRLRNLTRRCASSISGYLTWTASRQCRRYARRHPAASSSSPAGRMSATG